MDSDESTTRSLTPRQAAAVPLMTAMDQSVVNTSRPLSPPSPELQSTAPGAETVHGDCAPSTYGCAGPERFVAATAGQASTADSPGSFDHRVREETILDQPRLLYTSPSYTGPSGWSHRSAYHALVQDKTNVQITTTASYMMRVLGLRVSLSKVSRITLPIRAMMMSS
ncbi:hypothetical protein C8T65DRAFT_750038 [Cerioporus squamosus]|nr:hypothetical protein C8T65DRAFT_750038 [Cerioporus squamosus]